MKIRIETETRKVEAEIEEDLDEAIETVAKLFIAAGWRQKSVEDSILSLAEIIENEQKK